LPERFEHSGPRIDPILETLSTTREAYLICLVSKNGAPLLKSAVRNECSAYIGLIVLFGYACDSSHHPSPFFE
jgi:hypothetical protein